MTEAEAKLILEVRISRFDHAGDVNEALEIAKKALDEIKQYREIGTVEECREAREKQKAKRPKHIWDGTTECPECAKRLLRHYDFCPDCGQAIQWDNETDI